MNSTIDTSWMEIGVHIYNVFFAVSSFSLCTLAMYLIAKHSPSNFQGYQIVLFYNTCNLLIAAVLAVFLQGRILNTPTVYALLPIGPCRKFGPEVCFVTYNVYTASVLNGITSTALCMHFRYSVMKFQTVPRKRLIRNILIFSLPPLSMLITTHLAPFQFEKVMEVTKAKYPEYDLAAYGRFGGFPSVQDPIFEINTMMLLLAAYIVPILIFYWRRKILCILSANQHTLSPKTLQSSRIMALTYQSLLPVIAYIPNITHFLLVSIFEYRLQITEYTPTLTSNIPCVLDPLITMYFLAPYRSWVLKKFGRSSQTTVKVIPASSNNGSR